MELDFNKRKWLRTLKNRIRKECKDMSYDEIHQWLGENQIYDVDLVVLILGKDKK